MRQEDARRAGGPAQPPPQTELRRPVSRRSAAAAAAHASAHAAAAAAYTSNRHAQYHRSHPSRSRRRSHQAAATVPPPRILCSARSRARTESAGVADDDLFAMAIARRGLRDYLDGVHQSRIGRQRPGAHRQRGEPGGKPGAKTNPLQKYIESLRRALRAGCQEEDQWRSSSSINHSEADINGLAGNVTIWGRTQKSEEDAQGTFSFNTNLAPYETKELSVPLNTKRKIYELGDWQNITTDVQITAPAGGA